MRESRTIPLILLCCLAAFACGQTLAADTGKVIHLTTTTSTVNSGLMQKLLPVFEAETGYHVIVEAYGSGRAMRSAREGNADIIIVHAPAAEKKFMQAGEGVGREALMKNVFLLVGPADDPAGVANSKDVVSAMQAIAHHHARFISRGDDSGTQKRELFLWQKAGIHPLGKWYIEYGLGMGKTLVYASEQHAYTLVDKGTWLHNRPRLKLSALFEGDPLLDNPYHVILVNAARHPDINQKGARRFEQWLLSPEGQDIIRHYTVAGEQLFIPAR